MAPSPREDEEQQEETRKALLAAEAASLALIAAAVARSRRRGTRRKGSPMRIARFIADDLRIELVPALAQARQRSRQASVESLFPVLVNVDLDPSTMRRLAAQQGFAWRLLEPDDIARAEMLAAHFGRYWYEQSGITIEELKSPTRASLARAVAKAEKFRVEMTATTETARAFNEQRELAYDALAETAVGRDTWRLWDATLDRRTCPICDEMHGETVPLGDSFPAGTPGYVHPNCRCVEQMTFYPDG
tara:strand:+ start:2486 stop:3226 length:741 start_codon:yes stop_codon:yes gene_type:complete